MQKSKKIIAALGVVAGLGVSTLPLTSYAAESHQTVSVTVESNISVGVTPSGSVSLAPNGVALDQLKHTIKVSTNNLNGYTLTVKDKDADTALVHSTKTSIKIPSTDATPTSGTSSWAVQTAAAYTGMTSGLNTSWKAMPASTASGLIIKKSGAINNALTNDTTELKIGVALSESQETGTYSDEITYTAIAD